MKLKRIALHSFAHEKAACVFTSGFNNKVMMLLFIKHQFLAFIFQLL